jgi:uncharacterized membrane protein
MNGISALKKEILELSLFTNVFSLLLCFGGVYCGIYKGS